MNRLEMLTRARGRILETTATINQKLAAAKAERDHKNRELEGLRRRRAREAVNPSFQGVVLLEKIDKNITELEEDLKNVPFVIEELEKKLEASKEKDDANMKVYNDFKARTSMADMKKKSMLLSKKLREVEKINKEIVQFHDERLLIEKSTGKRMNVMGITGGFKSLKILAEVCEGENNGQPRAHNRWSQWIVVLGTDEI